MVRNRIAMAESISQYGIERSKHLGGLPLRAGVSRRAPSGALWRPLRNRACHARRTALTLYRPVRSRPAATSVSAARKRLAAESPGGRRGTRKPVSYTHLTLPTKRIV